MERVVGVTNFDPLAIDFEQMRHDAVIEMNLDDRLIEEHLWRATLAIIGGLNPYLQEHEKSV